jgi:putative transposase
MNKTMNENKNTNNEVDPAKFAKAAIELGSIEKMKESGAYDELMDAIANKKIELDGRNGFISQLIKTSLESGLKAELADHLGYGKFASL